MAILKINFEQYHDAIKQTKQDTPNKVRTKRDNIKRDIENNLPDLYENEYGEKLKCIDFIHQGSYAIDTVIYSYSVDIDYGLIITPHDDFDVSGDTKPLKEIVKTAIIATNRVPEINKPCITVTYTSKGEEDFHLDFPIYVKIGDQYYLAWGKPTQSIEKRVFQIADPYALNEWFYDHLSAYDWMDDFTKKEREQTRRLVRYLKYWKYLNYGEDLNNLRNTKEVPPSIALTLLVCRNYQAQYYDGKLCDLRSLYYVLENAWNELFITWDDEYINICQLPTIPWTDTLFKLRENKESIKKFRKKLALLRDKLKATIDETSEKKAAEILAGNKILGEDFPILEENTKANESGDSFA